MMDVFLKKHFWVIYLVAVAACALLLGHAASSGVKTALMPSVSTAPEKTTSTPAPAVEVISQVDVDSILNTNIFCSTCAPVVQENQPPPDPTPVHSSLPLQVVSTLVHEDVMISRASLKDGSDKENPYRWVGRGDSLGPDVRVAQIVSRKVYIYIVSQKKVEFIDETALPKNIKPTPKLAADNGLERDIDQGVRCDAKGCEIKRDLMNKLLANTTSLANGARSAPALNGEGKPTGIKIFAIRPSSFFGKIGLENGDTLKTINGLDVSSPDKILEVYTKLKSASHLTVSLERRGESKTLDYQIR